MLILHYPVFSVVSASFDTPVSLHSQVNEHFSTGLFQYNRGLCKVGGEKVKIWLRFKLRGGGDVYTILVLIGDQIYAELIFIFDLLKGHFFYLGDDVLQIRIEIDPWNPCNEISVLLKHLSTKDKQRAWRR